MKPAPFEYIAPNNLDEALIAMEVNGFDGKLLAGGQSLIPVMNFRLAQPAVIVDLNGVTELDFIRPNPGGGVTIGALTRQSRLEHDAIVRDRVPLLHATIPFIAHPQIRNRGTIGGSLAHADPAGELPVLSVALQARFKLQRYDKERWVNATDFYQALFMTALEPQEIMTAIEIPPLPPRTGWAFQELARRHGDYAQAGVATLIALDDDGVCTYARLVFLNVGEIPMVATEAAQLLVGERISAESITAVVNHAIQHEIEPTSDVHASADYKRHLAGVLTKRAIRQAANRVTS
ncbi:MAG: xanthine dehydrogenase family protein subunit M [Anaerolineae bacterium]|nr:xanthine dehydrogenase family protein subunit M [Anaerolineae bacterium]